MSTSEKEVVPRAPTRLVLPDQIASLDTRSEKYYKNDERTIEDLHARVAAAIVAKEPADKQDALKDDLLWAFDNGWLFGGRIWSAAGALVKATLINCFVQEIGDWLTGVKNGIPGIYDALAKVGETLRRGGGEGMDFSRIRPKGAFVAGTNSRASGPLSFMEVFDASCKVIESAGARRGAQMGVLRVDHPDIYDFVTAKSESGRFTQFNLSVAITQDFLEALEEGRSFDLVHEKPPYEFDDELSRRTPDGKWVYQTIDPRELWDLIMEQTYSHAEPGVLFVDQANAENNLYYCEVFAATNPCAEQWLPPYGCCCLGSVNLTRLVHEPFTDKAWFDYERFAKVVAIGTRGLDNVLDVTSWPLDQQREEAFSKRRIGIGFTGLGNALTMLGIRYDSEEGLNTAKQIAEAMRDAAYASSVELAKEKGPFKLFRADKYLESRFVKRLPEDIRDGIAKHGTRNSHLLSIAPTGTISLAMADNASNGIEPAFSWYYQRKKRTADGGHKTYPVVDHAFRVYCASSKGVDPAFAEEEELQRLAADLPDSFVSAQEIAASDHVRMLEVVQPYIDSSISKTVNVPETCAFDSFKDLYSQAAKAGLKGLATYRPNDVTGAVLSVKKANEPGVGEITLEQSDIDRRLTIDSLPEPVMASLRWPKRPALPNGNPARTYMVKTDTANFAVFVGYTENGTNHPFEVWVNGSEQPRGLGAIAKALSMDMRCNDRAFLKAKLDRLERIKDGKGFEFPMPPDGRIAKAPSLVSGFAKILKHSIEELEAFPPRLDAEAGGTDLVGSALTPMMDALMKPREPANDSDGWMSWSVNVRNHATGDDFVLFAKELLMPDGQRRPFACMMAGEYPKVFDGLCAVLNDDMLIVDPAWVAAKLRSLTDFAEPQGDFLAPLPGTRKQANFPSTVAYVARLLLHRYAMLGIFDEDGFPVEEAGFMDADYHNVVKLHREPNSHGKRTGKLCTSCHEYAVIRRAGCSYCEACHEVGDCG
jgi:ribonucleoside-diphosphate reductase alpha chain